MAEPKPAKQSEGAMRVDTDLIRELAELLSANELTEIEVEDGDRKIKVRREAAPTFAAAPAPVHQAPAAPAGPAATGAAA
jgi:acetyl-CoA carboxylase biotin carboxyl carrier protein